MIFNTETLNNGNLVETFKGTIAGKPKKKTFGVQIFESGERQKLIKVESFNSKNEADLFVNRLKTNIL